MKRRSFKLNKIDKIELIPQVILALIFAALKLDGAIDWSWLWVFSPIFAWEIIKLIITIMVIYKP